MIVLTSTTVTAINLNCQSSNLPKTCKARINRLSTNNFNVQHTASADIEALELYFGQRSSLNALPQELFTTFPNLRNLTLEQAKIKTISSDDLKLAGNLNELTLPGSQLERLSSRTFAPATNLTILGLEENRIHTIEDFAFEGLAKLSELWLRDNNLTRINIFTFIGLVSLQHLNLRANAIEVIEPGALSFPNLLTLYLNENKLKLYDSIFAFMPKLISLHIQSNHIQQLNNALQPLHSLHSILLDNNKIEDFDFKELTKFVNLTLVSIENIGLDLDTVNVTPDEINASMSTVSDLFLSGNRADSGKIFEKLKLFPLLSIVHLEKMSLKNIDLEVIRTGGLPKLAIIYLFGNSFDMNRLEQTARNLTMEVQIMEWSNYFAIHVR